MYMSASFASLLYVPRRLDKEVTFRSSLRRRVRLKIIDCFTRELRKLAWKRFDTRHSMHRSKTSALMSALGGQFLAAPARARLARWESAGRDAHHRGTGL